MACLALTSNLLVRNPCPTLTSNHIGTNPIITSESPSTHIWHMRGTNPTYMLKKAQHLYLTHVRNQSNIHVQKSLHLHPTHARNQSNMHVQRDLHLYLTHVRNQSNMHVRKGSTLTSNTCEEPIQHACSKGICTYIWHIRGTDPTCMFERSCTNI